MKKALFFVLALAFLLPLGKNSRAAEEYDAQHTLLALNYAIMSIYRVEKYPSRVTVDEEYNGIINNLAVGNITDDQELIDLFTSMMDAYTEDKLEDKDRELLRRQYEAQVNSAFLKVKPLKHIQTEVAFSSAKEAIAAVRDSHSFLSGFVATAGVARNGFVEYTLALQANERMRMQAQSEEQEFMQQRMTSEWALDKEKIRRFNGLKKNLLNAEWRLLRKYNLPDEARLTEETVSQFYSFISDKDIAKALRSAKRLEKTFHHYPPFWFYYGKAALENGDAQLARDCFEKFEAQSRRILRKDQFAASTARYKIFTLRNSEQDEAKRLLTVIEDNSAQDDWNNYLFCALQWYALGDKKRADDLLVRNIDFNYDVPLHSELRRQLVSGKIDLSQVKSVVIREFSDPTELEKLAESGNAEAQYQLGVKLSWDYSGTGKNNISKSMIWIERAAAQHHPMAYCCLQLSKWHIEKTSLTRNDYDKVYKILSDNMSVNKDAPYYMGWIFEHGIYNEKDINKSIELYKQSSDMGCAGAKIKLARFYIKNDPEKTKQLLIEADDCGNSFALVLLGNYIEQGKLNNNDSHYILRLYETAIKKGNILALYRAASRYQENNNYEKAIEYYNKAAEQGMPRAQFWLARFYEKGQGVAKDIAKAVYWYTKSAEQGDAFAQNNLAFSYHNGEGVQKDLAKAVYWYQKSAEQGNASAQDNLAWLYRKGEGVEKDLTKAFYWYTKSAEQGNASAQLSLGFLYDKGQGVAKDIAKAVYWYTKSAEQGNAVAQNNLAFCYQNGEGVQKDLAKAVYWYQKSAEQGNAVAQLSLGFYYEKGHGVQRDLAKSVYWFQKSAEQGNALAQNNLAFCYQNGKGVQKDLAKAAYWYTKSAEQGNAPAQYNLGYCYALGNGVQKDIEKAVYWLKKAAAQGDKDAQDALRRLGR